MKLILSFFLIFATLICSSQTDKQIEEDAYLYYDDFINATQITYDGKVPLSRNTEIDSLDSIASENFKLDIKKGFKYHNAAELALDNLLKLWELNLDKRILIYHAIQQLGCYLNKDLDYIKLPENQSFFPIEEFTNLNKNWKCDYTINYLSEMYSSYTIASDIEKQLINLEEPNLYIQKFNDSYVYRFTWLRSFHNPIVIRIVGDNTNNYLHWKIGKGQGGYAPKGIKKKGKVKISEEEWEQFQTLIDHENFINLRQNQLYLSGDGARWLLEQKSKNYYKAKLTNKPDTDLHRGCMYLLKLSGIKISEKETY